MKKAISPKKTAICLVLCIALMCFCDLVLPSGEGRIYDNVIRLHILANSDSAADQTLKLKVRDAILEAEVFSAAEDMDSALEQAEAAAKRAVEIANEVLAQEGADYGATFVFGEESYPTRSYGDISLPSGRYKSLRIVLGDGGGRNWWCVLFPPLCIGTATSDDLAATGLDENETKVFATGKTRYKLRFWLIEWLF